MKLRACRIGGDSPDWCEGSPPERMDKSLPQCARQHFVVGRMRREGGVEEGGGVVRSDSERFRIVELGAVRRPGLAPRDRAEHSSLFPTINHPSVCTHSSYTVRQINTWM
jgi:hypothetical protein